MKKIFLPLQITTLTIVFTLGLLTIAKPTLAEKVCNVPGKSNKLKMNLYSGPGKHHKIIRRLKVGTKIRILNTISISPPGSDQIQESWFKVIDQKRIGYITYQNGVMLCSDGGELLN